MIQTKSARQERTYDKENYIDFRMRLLGDDSSGPTVLSPGIHSFPFKLGLPLVRLTSLKVDFITISLLTYF